MQFTSHLQLLHSVSTSLRSTIMGKHQNTRNYISRTSIKRMSVYGRVPVWSVLTIVNHQMAKYGSCKMVALAGKLHACILLLAYRVRGMMRCMVPIHCSHMVCYTQCLQLHVARPTHYTTHQRGYELQ